MSPRLIQTARCIYLQRAVSRLTPASCTSHNAQIQVRREERLLALAVGQTVEFKSSRHPRGSSVWFESSRGSFPNKPSRNFSALVERKAVEPKRLRRQLSEKATATRVHTLLERRLRPLHSQTSSHEVVQVSGTGESLILSGNSFSRTELV